MICCSNGDFENSNTQIAERRGVMPPETQSDNDYQHLRCGHLSKVASNKWGPHITRVPTSCRSQFPLLYPSLAIACCYLCSSVSRGYSTEVIYTVILFSAIDWLRHIPACTELKHILTHKPIHTNRTFRFFQFTSLDSRRKKKKLNIETINHYLTINRN